MEELRTSAKENKDTAIKTFDSLLRCGTLTPGERLEVEIMRRKNLENLIAEKHKYQILQRQDSKGIWYTKSPKDYRKQWSAKTRDALLEKLYAYYYGESEKTVAELAEGAIEWYCSKKHLTSETKQRYLDYYHKYLIDSEFGALHVQDVKPSNVEEYFTSFSEKVTRHQLGNLKSLINITFDYAYSLDLVSMNVARGYNSSSVKTLAENNRLDNVYTDDDRQKIMSVTQFSSSQYNQAICFCFCLCIRMGELRALHIEDVDLEKRQVLIHSEIVRRRGEDGKRHWLEVPHTKTGRDSGTRLVALSDRALGIIKRAIGDRTTGYIFISTPDGRFLDDDTLRLYLKNACAAAGVRYLSPHKMRFWAASALAKQTTDITELMRYGGWASKETALHYIRESRLAENGQKVANAVFN